MNIVDGVWRFVDSSWAAGGEGFLTEPFQQPNLSSEASSKSSNNQRPVRAPQTSNSSGGLSKLPVTPHFSLDCMKMLVRQKVALTYLVGYALEAQQWWWTTGSRPTMVARLNGWRGTRKRKEVGQCSR
ncbi:hypothetical protein EMCG_07003 [[Emmonsia] crescens]|uniref:Uncharacterized protein n=1 Tax=[Emmonsia] crescens TaxID=73230 RepID=A0A0G2J651_9EURO|nr:hypothetical protein EMCG_07003 [Emmonsia crescens UAMH 3008]